MVDGVPTGQGTISAYKNDKKILDYVGGIVDGEASGQGRLTTYDTAGAVAATYSGLWAQGKPAGPGTVVRLPNPPGALPVPSPQSTYSAKSTAVGQSPPSQPVSAANFDPSGRSEIADISDFFHSLGLKFIPMTGVGIDGYNRILKDPSAGQFETKIAIANGFLYRARSEDQDQDAWKKDLTRLGYMKTARIWYQMAFSQLKQEHPEIDPAAYPPPDGQPPVSVTELPRTLQLNKGKDVGDTEARNLRAFILSGYRYFKDTPDEATLKMTQASLEKAQRLGQLQEAQVRNGVSENREARLGGLQALAERADSTTLTNKAVTSAVQVYLDDADDQRLADLKNDVVKLQDSIKKCEINTRLADLPLNKSVYEACQDRDEGYQRNVNSDQREISNFTYRSSQYEFAVSTKAKNYEGNMIAYVDFRKHGTDDIGRYKVTMRYQKKAWIVVGFQWVEGENFFS